MSAFCVFGMTESLARHLAQRRSPPPEAETEAGYASWLNEQIDTIMESSKVRQVSPEFDAPQFCHDWISLARRAGRAVGLTIMVRDTKRDKYGSPVFRKGTETPIMSWRPY